MIANDLLVTGEKIKIEEQLKNYESYKTACVFYKIKNRFSQLKFFREKVEIERTLRETKEHEAKILFIKKKMLIRVSRIIHRKFCK